MEIVIGVRDAWWEPIRGTLKFARFDRISNVLSERAAIHAGKHKLFTLWYGSIASFISLYTYERETAAEMGIPRVTLAPEFRSGILRPFRRIEDRRNTDVRTINS